MTKRSAAVVLIDANLCRRPPIQPRLSIDARTVRTSAWSRSIRLGEHVQPRRRWCQRLTATRPAPDNGSHRASTTCCRAPRKLRSRSNPGSWASPKPCLATPSRLRLASGPPAGGLTPFLFRVTTFCGCVAARVPPCRAAYRHCCPRCSNAVRRPRLPRLAGADCAPVVSRLDGRALSAHRCRRTVRRSGPHRDARYRPPAARARAVDESDRTSLEPDHRSSRRWVRRPKRLRDRRGDHRRSDHGHFPRRAPGIPSWDL